MNRRKFLSNASAGAMGLFGFDFLSPFIESVIASAPPLTISGIETVRFKNAHWMWLRIHTSEAIRFCPFDKAVARNKLFFEDPLSVVNGHITPPDLPGLGLQFKKGLFEQKDVIIEKIA